MNKIISILSHCNTNEKLLKLKENIEILKKNTNIPILLNSHISLPQEILNMVDFFIYDSSNPILNHPYRSLERWTVHMMGNNKITLSSYLPDYGWTPFNKIKNTILFLNNKEYECVFFMNYDLSLTESILQQINKESSNMFFNVKTENGELFLPGLIAFNVKYDDLKKWLDFMSVDKYCEFGIAEDYLRFFVALQKHKTYPEYVTDSIRHDNDKKINDNSPLEEFSFFIDNNTQKRQENIFIYSVKKQTKLFLDEIEVEIIPNINYIFKKPNNIKIMSDNELIQLEPINLNKFQEIKNVQ